MCIQFAYSQNSDHRQFLEKLGSLEKGQKVSFCLVCAHRLPMQDSKILRLSPCVVLWRDGAPYLYLGPTSGIEILF